MPKVDIGSLIDDGGDQVRSSFRVHRSTMTSSKILQLERERVFDTCWLYVGHESEIRKPGDFVRRSVGGRPVFLVRGSDGEIRTFYNTCTHRGATVCRQSSGNAKTFQCFYHAWTFDNLGKLVGLPDAAGYGPDFDQQSMGLQEVPHCERYRGFVFLCYARVTESLCDYLADAKEYLDLIIDGSEAGFEILRGTNEYTIRANWKLLVENSLDGYHVPPLHQTYLQYASSFQTPSAKGSVVDPTDAGSSFLATGFARDLGNGHAATEKLAPWGRPIARWSPLFGDDTRETIAAVRRRLVERWGDERTQRIADNSRNLLIFPNLIVNDAMGLTVRNFFPVSPGEMRVLAWEMAPLDEPPALRAKRLDSFLTFLGPGGFSTPDDMEALESCQEGFSADGVAWSDISRGMARDPVPVDELQMRTFWRRWAELLAQRTLSAV